MEEDVERQETLEQQARAAFLLAFNDFYLEYMQTKADNGHIDVREFAWMCYGHGYVDGAQDA